MKDTWLSMTTREFQDSFRKNIQIAMQTNLCRGKTKHSNVSQLYVTLDRLDHFNKNFVAFGRVIEGMDLFKRVNEEQDEQSLVPTSNLKITSIDFFLKKPDCKHINAFSISNLI